MCLLSQGVPEVIVIDLLPRRLTKKVQPAQNANRMPDKLRANIPRDRSTG